MTQNFQEVISGFESFHPTAIPRGMKDYAIDIEITPQQQNLLNYHKLTILRDNHEYLKSHPEIKNVVILLLEEVLRKRPSTDIDMFMTNYFFDNSEKFARIIDGSECAPIKQRRTTSDDFRDSIYSDIIERPSEKYQSVSSSNSSSFAFLESAWKSKSKNLLSRLLLLGDSKNMCKSIVNEIVDEISDNESTYQTNNRVRTTTKPWNSLHISFSRIITAEDRERDINYY